jgi:hypothetical protein
MAISQNARMVKTTILLRRYRRVPKMTFKTYIKKFIKTILMLLYATLIVGGMCWWGLYHGCP